MPTFTPPTAPGLPAADPSKNDIANRLFRFFGAWDTGQTVWQDQAGVWHQSIHPFSQDLDAAQVVYEGGHVHPITSEEETALIAAGFEDYIEE